MLQVYTKILIHFCKLIIQHKSKNYSHSRKNPQHRIDFAHPGDSEYIDQATTSNDSVDNRPLCQYGAACYRKNPQHRLDYKHDAPKKRAARPSRYFK